jgi:hypothetical protein
MAERSSLGYVSKHANSAIGAEKMGVHASFFSMEHLWIALDSYHVVPTHFTAFAPPLSYLRDDSYTQKSQANSSDI